MKNTIVKFNNKIYHQIFGAPMGSNLSPIIAEILVQYIFKTAIKTCHNPPRIAKLFADDSFLIIKKRHFQYFFTHINNLEKSLENIKFTSELENSKGELPFLDIFISRLNFELKTQVYRKPTHSNRYLNFHSYHCLENFYSKLELKCIFETNGCHSICRIEDLESHQNKCQFNPLSERDCDKGCGASMVRNEASNHNCVEYLKKIIENSMEEKEGFLRRESENSVSCLRCFNINIFRIRLNIFK